jgi:hypothetical protein
MKISNRTANTIKVIGFAILITIGILILMSENLSNFNNL